MNLRKPSLSEVVIFSRITGAALLIGGYIIGGLYIGHYLTEKGYPQIVFFISVLAGLAGAALSGIHEIRAVISLIRGRHHEKNGNLFR